jgi:hypothetical protein
LSEALGRDEKGRGISRGGGKISPSTHLGTILHSRGSDIAAAGNGANCATLIYILEIHDMANALRYIPGWNLLIPDSLSWQYSQASVVELQMPQ